MMAVFEQGVFDRLRAIDEEAAIEAVLFLGDPVAAFVATDENNLKRRTTRWRFDDLHVGIASKAGATASTGGACRRCLLQLFGSLLVGGKLLDPCGQYHRGQI